MTEKIITPVQALEEKIKMIDLQIEGVKSNIAIQQEILFNLADKSGDYIQAIKILNNAGMPKAKENVKPFTLADKIEPETESKTYKFEEIKSNGIEWNEPYNYKDVEMFKSSDEAYRKIRWNKSTIITTWDYLKSFYESLPERFTRQSIEGLSSLRKGSVLLRFYEAHPNFTCIAESDYNKYEIIKLDPDVKLNQDTNGGDIAIEFDDAGVKD